MMTYLPAYEKNYKDIYGNPVTYSEWCADTAKVEPYRDRVMKALNRLRFKGGIWKPVPYENPYEIDRRLYHFVCDVRLLAGMPVMSKEKYDEGRIYRHVLVENYKYALEEMWLLCWGDW